MDEAVMERRERIPWFNDGCLSLWEAWMCLVTNHNLREMLMLKTYQANL